MLTDRFSAALTYAEGLHRAQTRKGNDIPYVAHLMAVCAIVLEWGGDEDTAIAALLHDAAEDQGGEKTLADIADHFGPRVAGFVAACSDSLTAEKTSKAPWLERKQAYIAKLAAIGPEVALISIADKLHNLQAQFRDVERHGPATMSRFNAGAKRIVWYNRSVASALDRYRVIAPLAEMERAIDRLAGLLGLETGGSI